MNCGTGLRSRPPCWSCHDLAENSCGRAFWPAAWQRTLVANLLVDLDRASRNPDRRRRSSFPPRSASEISSSPWREEYSCAIVKIGRCRSRRTRRRRAPCLVHQASQYWKTQREAWSTWRIDDNELNCGSRPGWPSWPAGHRRWCSPPGTALGKAEQGGVRHEVRRRDPNLHAFEMAANTTPRIAFTLVGARVDDLHGERALVPSGVVLRIAQVLGGREVGLPQRRAGGLDGR